MICLKVIQNKFVPYFAFLIMQLVSCSVERNLDALFNAETAKTIYEPGGEIPAKKALVKVFSACSGENEPVAVYLTDDNGQISLIKMTEGIYNIWVEKDSFVLFQDSVVVTNEHSTLEDDTLERPSSISGIVGLQNYHDTRTVMIHMKGIDRPVVFADGDGRFVMNGLASGNWKVFLQSSIQEYLPTEKTIAILAGSKNTIKDTFRLYFSGIPIVSGITFIQDTLVGTMRLSWNKPTYKIIRDYLIYHASCGGNVFSKEPSYITEDTSCIDSIYFRLSADSADTVQRCVLYRIAIRNTVPQIGAFSSTIGVPFAPKSYVTTFFHHAVKYANDSLANASVHDTVTISLAARNRTRPLRSIIWYDLVAKDTIFRRTAGAFHSKTIYDTLHYAFNDTGKKYLQAIVIDDAGIKWFDTVRADIINNTLSVKATAKDTVIYSTDSIYLHGEAETQFGKIARWEWKIGSEQWNVTSTPDTIVPASSFNNGVTCSLAVTDEDGKRIVDAVSISVISVSARKILKIAAGGYHDLFLDDQSMVQGRGVNSNGELGSKTTLDWFNWRAIMSEVRSMDAGESYSLFVKHDETVWACGYNKYGQLGDGSRITRYEPVKVLTGGLSVAASSTHSLFLKNDGTLWSCGSNKFGQLGDSTAIDRLEPVQIMENVVRISAGGSHSLVLKADGSLWACGSNRFGQLGDGTTVDKLYPVKIMTSVRAMDAGAAHSLIVKTDGTLWSCGLNYAGQLGDNTTFNRSTPIPIMDGVKEVAAGDYHSVILKNDQTLWTWGENSLGQLGDSTLTGRLAPVKILGDIRSVFAGGSHTIFIKNSGTIWICGWISFNADSYESTEMSPVPQRIIPE
jgi:alpha-tubulin suppressor-like RCC1 family protein